MVTSINNSPSFGSNYSASFDKNRLRAICHIVHETPKHIEGTQIKQVQQQVHLSIPNHLDAVFEKLAQRYEATVEKLPESVQTFLGRTNPENTIIPLDEIGFRAVV